MEDLLRETKIKELKKAYNKLEKDLGEIYLEGSPITNIGDNDLSAPINADLCRLEKIINSLVQANKMTEICEECRNAIYRAEAGLVIGRGEKVLHFHKYCFSVCKRRYNKRYKVFLV